MNPYFLWISYALKEFIIINISLLWPLVAEIRGAQLLTFFCFWIFFWFFFWRLSTAPIRKKFLIIDEICTSCYYGTRSHRRLIFRIMNSHMMIFLIFSIKPIGGGGRGISPGMTNLPDNLEVCLQAVYFCWNWFN